MTDDRTWMTNNQALTYRVDNGTPNQLTQSISPWVNDGGAGLPGGGGYIVDGLYDVIPAKAGQVDNFVTDSTAFGRWYQHFNGLDVTVSARVGDSFRLVGGTSTGQTVADNCDVRARACRSSPPRRPARARSGAD